MFYSLSVHPNYRGRRIGRALLEATLEYVRNRGAHSGMLYVDAENDSAQRLYLNEGFRVIASIG
jgi:mycothiol synthase